LALIYASHLSPADYFPAALSTETWLAIYETPMPVINTEDLELDDDNECNPPRTRKPRGRPKKKKENRATHRATRGLQDAELELGEEGQAIRPRNRCGTCGETGHNVHTCRQPHQ
jgi:hypothetical protein